MKASGNIRVHVATNEADILDRSGLATVRQTVVAISARELQPRRAHAETVVLWVGCRAWLKVEQKGTELGVIMERVGRSFAYP